MDDFFKYQALRDDGKSASEVCASAKTDGLDHLAMIRMLRQVFGLSLVEAKKVWFEVDTGRPLDAHHADLATQLPEVLDSFLRDR